MVPFHHLHLAQILLVDGSDRFVEEATSLVKFNPADDIWSDHSLHRAIVVENVALRHDLIGLIFDLLGPGFANDAAYEINIEFEQLGCIVEEFVDLGPFDHMLRTSLNIHDLDQLYKVLFLDEVPRLNDNGEGVEEFAFDLSRADVSLLSDLSGRYHMSFTVFDCLKQLTVDSELFLIHIGSVDLS